MNPEGARTRIQQIQKKVMELQGRKVYDQWIGRIAKASGFHPSRSDFLPVEETMTLKRAFVDHLKSVDEDEKETWPAARADITFEYIKNLHGAQSQQPVVVFSSVDPLIGAVMIPLTRVLGNAQRLWAVTEEDLSVTTNDVSSGLCIEFDYYAKGDYSPDGYLHLTTWGPLFLRDE